MSKIGWGVVGCALSAFVFTVTSLIIIFAFFMAWGFDENADLNILGMSVILNGILATLSWYGYFKLTEIENK